jgi:hexosaminidase
MPNGRHVEYMAWPRLCAVAEMLWSPREVKDFASFKTRLVTHLERLRAKDVNFRPLEGPFPARFSSPTTATAKP